MIYYFIIIYEQTPSSEKCENKIFFPVHKDSK